MNPAFVKAILKYELIRKMMMLTEKLDCIMCDRMCSNACTSMLLSKLSRKISENVRSQVSVTKIDYQVQLRYENL